MLTMDTGHLFENFKKISLFGQLFITNKKGEYRFNPRNSYLRKTIKDNFIQISWSFAPMCYL